MTRREIRLTPDPVFEHIDDLVKQMLQGQIRSRSWAPRVDVHQTDTEVVAVAELAGVDPDAVTVEIEGQEIAIVGQRAQVRRIPSTESESVLQLEIPYGRFERRLVLPMPVDANAAQASFDRGLLVVRLPKLHPGPTRVPVERES